MKERFEVKFYSKHDSINELCLNEDLFEMSEFKKLYKELNHWLDLIEEVTLKEKLCFKRALILCRSLLKECRIMDVNDQNVIQICEVLIQPSIHSQDPQNQILALECIGLMTILDSDLFSSYSQIFTKILTEEDDEDKDVEKVIALKSSYDGLIVHGVTDDHTQALFQLLTNEYLTIPDKVLRQVTIEGVCKMLFSIKLCESND